MVQLQNSLVLRKDLIYTKELLMNITPAIFRMYDIRGVVKNALTPDTVKIIGQAFAAARNARLDAMTP